MGAMRSISAYSLKKLLTISSRRKRGSKHLPAKKSALHRSAFSLLLPPDRPEATSSVECRATFTHKETPTRKARLSTPSHRADKLPLSGF